MELELLEKIFTDVNSVLEKHEAEEKAVLFLETAKRNNIQIESDYWIQISKDWDLNICTKEHINKVALDGYSMCLYKVETDEEGYTHTNGEDFYPFYPAEDFPCDPRDLTEFLNAFENNEYYNTGMKMMSCGYTRAEYEDFDDDYIYFSLEWGIEGEQKNFENFKIERQQFDRPIGAYEKIAYVQDA